MIIDIHGHIGGWHAFFMPQTSAEWLVRTNERIGVTAVGVSHLGALGHDPAAFNRVAIDVARQHRGALGIWLVVNPHAGQDSAELREQLKDPVVWGLKLHPDFHELRLDSPRYAPYLELAATTGVAVLAHGQTDSGWSDPGMFGAVSDRHPNLRLVCGHSGLWPYGFDRAADIAAARANLFLDTSGSRLTGRMLARLVDRAGRGSVVFGSDAVFLDPRYSVGLLKSAPLTREDRDHVAFENAKVVLGDMKEVTHDY